jgi:ribosomal protein S18 acetylase RimI-like enzyme
MTSRTSSPLSSEARPEISVRPALPHQWPEVVNLYLREKDLPEIVEAEADGPKNFAAIGTERLIWFAWDQDKVVGLIQLILTFPETDLADGKTVGLVRHLKVDRDYEGLGIASRLHDALAAEARRRGLKRLTIECRKDNTHAFAVYRHWGYRVVRDGTDPADHILAIDL